MLTSCHPHSSHLINHTGSKFKLQNHACLNIQGNGTLQISPLCPQKLLHRYLSFFHQHIYMLCQDKSMHDATVHRTPTRVIPSIKHTTWRLVWDHRRGKSSSTNVLSYTGRCLKLSHGTDYWTWSIVSVCCLQEISLHGSWGEARSQTLGHAFLIQSGLLPTASQILLTIPRLPRVLTRPFFLLFFRLLVFFLHLFQFLFLVFLHQRFWTLRRVISVY